MKKETPTSWVKMLGIVCWVMSLVGTGASPAAAEEATSRIGMHAGLVIPLVAQVNGSTVNITDNFVFGVPVGIALYRNERFIFDFEVVPTLDTGASESNLTLHPGLIFPVRPGRALGLRLAWDVRGPAWGFTPLYNQALPFGSERVDYFVEAVVPIRFNDEHEVNKTSVGFGVHFGLAF